MSEEESRWEYFYQKTDTNPPHELLINVLGLYPGALPQLNSILLALYRAGSDTLKIFKHGGRFAGRLFGVNDSWTNNPEKNFHTEA